MEGENHNGFDFFAMDSLSELISNLRVHNVNLGSEEECYEEDINEVYTEWEPIDVEAVDFHCKEQAKNHNTKDFKIIYNKKRFPVLRRGAPFFIAIRFKRPYIAEKDRLRLVFLNQQRNMSQPESFINLEVTKKTAFDRDVSQWDVYVSRETQDEVVLEVQIPTTAPVCIWRLAVITRTAYASGRLTWNLPEKVYDCQENIYILFNPWCKDDPVYMENEEWRQEYVLNDAGKLYNGTYDQPGGLPWAFDQFDPVVLHACMFILNKSELDFQSRGDPIQVVRTLSAMINSNDEGGVVGGKWEEPYVNGVHPLVWSGSGAILEQYIHSRGQPVRYGQCWVFSGVFTTVCRTLGIPCRSVTNYNSAHDQNKNVTIDTYIDIDGSVKFEEKFWNFHVWNECWMTRPDLPSGYGGWQAVDATPQEKSEGIFQNGPASVLAVRRGEIDFIYDSGFIYSEVNADCVTWMKDYTLETGWRPTSFDTTEVGKLITTKKLGYLDDDGIADMEDITDQYKAKEGSREDKMTLLNAARRHPGLAYLYDLPFPGTGDVEFLLRDIDKVMIGKPINMIIEMQNNSSEERKITAILSCSSVYYTGVHAEEVKKETASLVLQPYEREQHVIRLDFDDYYDKLVELSMMKIYALATVYETNQTWSSQDNFKLEKPSLFLEVEGRVKKHKPFGLRISFRNPLQLNLQECVLSIEVPKMERRQITLSDVLRGQRLYHEEQLVPKKSGTMQIVVVFNSVQLNGVFGSKTLVVEK